MFATKALRMVAPPNGVQALELDALLAPSTLWSQVGLPAKLTVKGFLLLHKADVHQTPAAIGGGTFEVFRTVKL